MTCALCQKYDGKGLRESHGLCPDCALVTHIREGIADARDRAEWKEKTPWERIHLLRRYAAALAKRERA